MRPLATPAPGPRHALRDDHAAADADVALCLVCDRRRTATGLLVCPTCRTAAGRDLDTVRDGYGRLDIHPGQQRADDGRSGGHGSRPPLRVPVLSLDAAPTDVVRGGRIDPDPTPADAPGVAPDSPPSARAHGARPGDPLLVTLGRIVDRAVEDGVVPASRGRRSVGGEAFVLGLHLDAVAGRWWVAEAFRDLRVAADDVRRALDEEVTTVPIGACPRPGPAGGRHLAVVEDVPGTASPAAPRPGTCGAQVRARRDRPAARCVAGHRWEGDAEVRALGVALGEVYLDLATLSEHLAAFRPGAGPVAVATLRKWAERDEWPRRRVGRRTLYRVAAAVDSAWRRWDSAHPVAGPVVPPVWLAETTIIPAVGAEPGPVLSAA